MSISNYPLQWPTGWPRATSFKDGKFHTVDYSGGRKRDISVSDGTTRVLKELAAFNIDRQDVIVSTNVRTRLDGLPRSGEREPDDSGVAVYWQDRKGERRVMAIDRYTTVGDNLAALAATLCAMRAIERHGGAKILERAFTGFTALPAPTATRHWSEVLEFSARSAATAESVKQQFRRLASIHHPDKCGGDNSKMAELNQARDEALKELEVEQ